MGSGRVSTGFAIAVSSVLASVPAHAAAPPELPEEREAEPGAAETPEPDPAVDAAAAHFDEGKLAYQTADYTRAVEKFTEAYREASSIRDEAQRENAMTLLLFNLAQAHAKAYELDTDTKHLRTARELLTRYLDLEQELENELDAQKLLREVTAELEQLEQRSPVPPEPSGDGGQAEPPARDEGGQRNGLVIGGAVVAGLAAPALGLMTAGLVMGNRAEQDFLDGPTLDDRNAATAKGKTGNVLAVAGAVGAAVLAGTGVALIIVGRKKAHDTRALHLTPGPGLVGAGVGGRF